MPDERLPKAFGYLNRLVEIVETMETDDHWTNYVEWLAEDVSTFLEKNAGTLNCLKEAEYLDIQTFKYWGE